MSARTIAFDGQGHGAGPGPGPDTVSPHAGGPNAPAAGATRSLSLVWPQLVLAILVGGLLAVRMGGPARIVFLFGSLAVGWRLHRTSPAAYVGFVLWLWFMTALVRRLTDLYASWQDPSMTLLTPYLVTGLSATPFLQALLRRGAVARARPVGTSMFWLAAAAVAFGIPFGFLLSPQMALLETLNYITPLALGLYVATIPEHARDIERQVAVTFGYAALVVGIYGIYQFTTAPPWDGAWMLNSEMGSIGRPEPYGIRVFSTMHGPGVMAAFLAVALVLWIAQPRAWGVPSVGAAGVTLLLSQVRSAWLQCVIGALLVVASLRAKQRLRAGMLIGLIVLSAGPLLVTPEMAELFGSRLSTFEQLGEDKSGLARITGHELALELVTRRPLGLGIGQTDERIEAYISMRDSTIVAALLQFGLVGALLYFLSLALVFGQVWRYYRRRASVEGMALACGGLGLLATTPLGVVSAGPIGIMFWLIAGLAIADRHLARVQQARARARALGRRGPRVRAAPPRDLLPA